MVTIRVAEEQIAKYYLENKVMSFVHFYVGQEAVAVGVSDALKKTDRMMGNHRSHGHYLAKGGDLKKMVAELLGKEAGCCKGKGGSMHMMDKSVGFVGSTPILGSSVPLACGSAFEQKYSKKDQVTVAFVGDGASEEGVVYETYNLAGLFKLPLLIVIENNLYSVNSKIKDRRASLYDTEKVVTGLGLTYVKADGNDYVDVAKKANILIEGVRKGIPAVLECVTYRHMAHSAPIFDDAQGYREVDVLEKRLEADPIKKIGASLIKLGMSETDLLKIQADILSFVQESIKFAVETPYPEAKELYTHLYA
jgi:pyruvate dehydrogenase E1 component alpha subunit